LINIDSKIGCRAYNHKVPSNNALQTLRLSRIMFKSINSLFILLIQLTTILLARKKFANASVIGNFLKEKIIISIIQLGKYNKTILEPCNDVRSSIVVEKYSCWCFLVIDEAVIEAKIIHKGRGKFNILSDKCSGKYIGKIVDASDVVYCRIDS
jgi:hypothetical protein